jgi:hypothetical protein
MHSVSARTLACYVYERWGTPSLLIVLFFSQSGTKDKTNAGSMTNTSPVNRTTKKPRAIPTRHEKESRQRRHLAPIPEEELAELEAFQPSPGPSSLPS